MDAYEEESFNAWLRTNRTKLLEKWGEYLDDPKTPGICKGFDAYCEEIWDDMKQAAIRVE